MLNLDRRAGSDCESQLSQKPGMVNFCWSLRNDGMKHLTWKRAKESKNPQIYAYMNGRMAIDVFSVFLEEMIAKLKYEKNAKQNVVKTYCWWKKPCPTWHVWNPVNNGIFIISTGDRRISEPSNSICWGFGLQMMKSWAQPQGGIKQCTSTGLNLKESQASQFTTEIQQWWNITGMLGFYQGERLFFLTQIDKEVMMMMMMIMMMMMMMKLILLKDQRLYKKYLPILRYFLGFL